VPATPREEFKVCAGNSAGNSAGGMDVFSISVQDFLV